MEHTRPPEQFAIDELLGFTPKQNQAREAVHLFRFVLYGGARGGGKSRWLRWMLVYLLLFWYFARGHRNVVVGLFCSTYPELRDRQIAKIALEFPAWLGELTDSKEYGLAFRLGDRWGGGVILLRNLDDPNKYKSGEFAAIGIDELTLLPTKETFDILRGSLRWPGIAHTVFLAATNPDGVGNLWVRELWIEGVFPPEMLALSKQFAFIQALPSDNPYLDEQYWADLRSQPEDIRRAWIEGDWYVFAGQAIRFRREKHVITPCEVPAWWIRKTAQDWGFAKPMCNLWGARDPDCGRWMIYRELYGAGLPDPRQAELVKQYEDAQFEHILRRFADPSMFAKVTKGQTGTATSTADIFAAHGLYLTPANNDRIAGKRKIDALLEDMPDGRPGLLVFDTCTNLIRTLPALVRDKTHPEDVDTAGEDHAYDALRYLLTDDVTQQAAARGKPRSNRHPLLSMRNM